MKKVRVWTEIEPGVFKSITGIFRCHKGVVVNFSDGTSKSYYSIEGRHHVVLAR